MASSEKINGPEQRKDESLASEWTKGVRSRMCSKRVNDGQALNVHPSTHTALPNEYRQPRPTTLSIEKRQHAVQAPAREGWIRVGFVQIQTKALLRTG